jgi:hypothetical protein
MFPLKILLKVPIYTFLLRHLNTPGVLQNSFFPFAHHACRNGHRITSRLVYMPGNVSEEAQVYSEITQSMYNNGFQE